MLEVIQPQPVLQSGRDDADTESILALIDDAPLYVGWASNNSFGSDSGRALKPH